MNGWPQEPAIDIHIPNHEECMRRLRAVSDAAIAITSELTLDKALQKIVDTARYLVNARYAALGVVDEERLRLTAFVTSGMAREEIEAMSSVPRGLGLLGLLLREPRPIRVKNIAEDPRSVGFPPHHPSMTSFMGAPIVSRGRILGNFYMADKTGREEFSQEDEDILVLFATHAAVAIENARLYTQTSVTLRQKVTEVEKSERQARFLADLSRLLLEAPLRDKLELEGIAERLTEPLGDATGIYLVDDRDFAAPRRRAMYHIDPARRQAAEEVVESAWSALRETVIVNRRATLLPLLDDNESAPDPLVRLVSNRRGFTGILAVPIAAKDRTYGMLVSLASQPSELTTDDLRFALLVADRLTAKLENIRLYQELGSQTSLLASILDTMSEAVHVADPAGNLINANRAYARLIGADTREDIERSLAEYSRVLKPRHEDGRRMSDEELPMGRALQGETFTNAVVLITPCCEMEDRYISISGAPIIDETGEIAGAVNVGRDVTELKELDRLKDEFISVASHEMKSPVAAAKGYAQLLARMLSAEKEHAKQAELANHVSQQIDRMAQLLERLLDVSRIQTNRLALHKEGLDLSQLASDVAQRMRMAAGGRTINVEASTPVMVLADGTRVEQIITNLLSNAIRYSPPGQPIDVAVNAADCQAQVSVKDKGVGIPKEKQPYVFERFFRAIEEGGGLGLGLYVCRGLVEAHGGRIWFDSQEGNGTTFHFTLPLSGASGKSRPPLAAFRRPPVYEVGGVDAAPK